MEGNMKTDLFERRKLEVFLAATTGGFGLFLLMPMQSMGTAAFNYVTADIPEPAWVLVFALNGLAHGLALAVNGSRWWSPLIRCWAAVYSAILYIVLAFGFAFYSPATTATWTYGSLSFGSAIAAYWAWKDSIQAVRLKRVLADNT